MAIATQLQCPKGSRIAYMVRHDMIQRPSQRINRRIDRVRRGTTTRGAASAAAGDKVCIVDANKKAYAYNTNRSHLGNWSAGSLSSSEQVEGIATNTDVWIVDARQDRVYRYANAASAVTGNINATSFPLNSGNKNPKRIVTDGTYLWVVNDSTTDKVFKYTTAGAFVGSWTITTPRCHQSAGYSRSTATQFELEDCVACR